VTVHSKTPGHNAINMQVFLKPQFLKFQYFKSTAIFKTLQNLQNLKIVLIYMFVVMQSYSGVYFCYWITTLKQTTKQHPLLGGSKELAVTSTYITSATGTCTAGTMSTRITTLHLKYTQGSQSPSI
jgi:hypothetical protein